MAHASGGDQRAMRDTGPASSAQAASVGTTYLAGRALHIICTVAGNVVVQFPDATTLTTAVANNTVYEYNWAVNQIVTSGTTATATYYILY
jgi:hypothetical protein